jgi:hypothetical protein
MSRNSAEDAGTTHPSGDHAGGGHGNTPAAWTAVTIGLAAFVVGGIGLMLGSDVTFWVGVALAPLALIVLVVMNKMGYGTSSARH